MRERAPKRTDIMPGQRVEIVLKQDQRFGKRTEGVVKDILTKSQTHSHGIKVRLENAAAQGPSECSHHRASQDRPARSRP